MMGEETYIGKKNKRQGILTDPGTGTFGVTETDDDGHRKNFHYGCDYYGK